MSINLEGLHSRDLSIIESLLLKSIHNPPELEDMWNLIDKVWDEIGCDNKNLDWKKIDRFYQHPVWILNGLFIEQHDISMQHRNAISDWIIKKKINRVLDYGGGFGTLSRLIAEKDSNILIDIYEPYPNNYSISRIIHYTNVRFINSINNLYDCIVSIDVLEHIPYPLKILSEMIRAVKKDGYLIIANNFYPVIKCHLPSTFHLRYTFKKFARLMGLEFIEKCNGSHASIYQKKRDTSFNWNLLGFFERYSRMLYLFLNTGHHAILKLKNILK